MSTIIDSKAGTHFPGKIFVTPHACDRAVERFGVERSKAPMHVMDLLRKAALIDGDMTDDSGNPVRLFAYKGTAFVVDRSEATVITLYPRDSICDAVKAPVERVVKRIIAAAKRDERREVKRLTIEKAELGVVKASVELRLAKTDSPKIADKLRVEITLIDEKITLIERGIAKAQADHKTIVKSAVAYV